MTQIRLLFSKAGEDRSEAGAALTRPWINPVPLGRSTPTSLKMLLTMFCISFWIRTSPMTQVWKEMHLDSGSRWWDLDVWIDYLGFWSFLSLHTLPSNLQIKLSFLAELVIPSPFLFFYLFIYLFASWAIVRYKSLEKLDLYRVFIYKFIFLDRWVMIMLSFNMFYIWIVL